jgi:hemoglobin
MFLYTRLGGYDAIAAVVDDLLPRLRADALLARFWTSPRSVDTNNRERQLAIDFIAANAGGPTLYLGRDMRLAHAGMGITNADYAAFMRCLSATLDAFRVPEPERGEVVAFATGLNRKSSRRKPTTSNPAIRRRTCRPGRPGLSVANYGIS